MWRSSLVRLLILAVLAASDAHATLIFVSWQSPGEILIAADSLYRHERNGASYRCKLRESPTFLWAIAGVSRDDAAQFDANNILEKHLKNRDEVPPNSFENLKSALYRGLQRSVTLHHKSGPDQLYRDHMEQKLFSFVIVNRQRATIAQCDTKIINGNAGAWSCATLPSANGQGGKFVLGDNDAAVAYLSTARGVTNQEIIKQIFPLSARALPQSIGGPTSIIRIKLSTTEWISRGACTATPR